MRCISQVVDDCVTKLVASVIIHRLPQTPTYSLHASRHHPQAMMVILLASKHLENDGSSVMKMYVYALLLFEDHVALFLLVHVLPEVAGLYS